MVLEQAVGAQSVSGESLLTTLRVDVLDGFPSAACCPWPLETVIFCGVFCVSFGRGDDVFHAGTFGVCDGFRSSTLTTNLNHLIRLTGS